VKKLFAIKKSERKPLSVMVADFGMIDDYCDTGIWEDVILRRYLPGPYTFILKRRVPIAASLTNTLGIRIPDSEFCRRLCERFGKPIITTSANLTGQPAPTRIGDVDKSLTDAVGLAVDAGETKYRGPSLIVDLVARKLIRPGGEAISLVEEIAEY
jgi:L-threonylcarbamoyladenylate synthase